LAAEVNWLIDHVRWDFEEDLSKLMGDAAANTLVSVGRQIWQALQKFAGQSAGTTELHRTSP
jgi:ubiquinone biosynthesis protein UbiJ